MHENFGTTASLFVQELLYLQQKYTGSVLTETFELSDNGQLMACALLPTQPVLRTKNNNIEELIPAIRADLAFLHNQFQMSKTIETLGMASIHGFDTQYFLIDCAKYLHLATSKPVLDIKLSGTVQLLPSIEEEERALALAILHSHNANVATLETLRALNPIYHNMEVTKLLNQTIGPAENNAKLHDILASMLLLKEAIKENELLQTNQSQLPNMTKEEERKQDASLDIANTHKQLSLPTAISQKLNEYLANPDPRQVKKVDLSMGKIGYTGAAALSNITNWINLQILELPHNEIGPTGAAALATNTSWTNLQYIRLYNNKIEVDGAAALANNTSWVNLTELYLGDKEIGDTGAAALTKNTSWINLRCLDLQDNEIGNNGASALAKNTSWVKLQFLHLEYNEIGDIGASTFGKNTSWVMLPRSTS